MAISSTDVALKAGTSTAVVSYVFNNGPRGVAPETRERVLRAAAELGYRPNRLARALRSGATGFVGVLTPDSSIPFFAELTRALVAALGRRELLALVSHAGISGRSESESIEALLSAQVDGLLVTAFWGETHSGLQLDVPVVYVHHRPPDSHGDLISSDNKNATLIAIDHFNDVHKVQEPAFWAGPDDVGPLGERTAAWLSRRRNAHQELLRSHFNSSDAERAFIERARLGNLPRAMVVATDQQATGILAGAYALGIRIPEELAVISLDGVPESAFTAPALSVVQQPLEQMADDAVSRLMGDTQKQDQRRSVLLPRRSCGCEYNRIRELGIHSAGGSALATAL